MEDSELWQLLAELDDILEETEISTPVTEPDQGGMQKSTKTTKGVVPIAYKEMRPEEPTVTNIRVIHLAENTLRDMNKGLISRERSSKTAREKAQGKNRSPLVQSSGKPNQVVKQAGSPDKAEKENRDAPG